jgi:RNA polymerase-binding transcription factor DksA
MRGYDPAAPINCIECGELVSTERLKLRPHTRRCLPCAADVERYRREVPSA